MNFRFIWKQVSSLSMTAAKRIGRRAGFGVMICTVVGASAFAQAQLDFLDPLGEERERIEKTDNAPSTSPNAVRKPAASGTQTSDLLSRAREGASSGAAAAQDKAGGLWSRMRAAMSDVAASLGLPTAGLLGILGLLLAGIACLVGWTLFRGRRRSDAPMIANDDIYQRDGKGRGRRMLGDRNPHIDAREAVDEDTFEETMPEDFETIFNDEVAEVKKAPIPPKTMDTAKWRKPNLDRLRDSIKSDWKADKADAAKAGLAGAGAAAVATVATTSSDPADRTLDDVSDGWEAWDTQVKPEDDPWGETLVMGDDVDDNSAALRRIRALRESLKAS